jgi:alcohol dehydrogenase class IV
MDYNPFCNTEILFENMEGLKQRILSLDVANVVLVMSESSVSRWNLTSFVHELQVKYETKNGALTWIKTITPNPNPIDIIQSLLQIGNRQIDTIIAIGGGSVIDLAKAISAFHSTGTSSPYSIAEIKDSIRNKKYQGGEFIDIIAVPSTAGTGSEVTQWATIWDENKTCKFSIDDPGIKPKLAIIVPELTISMSAELTLSTGLDAMCQSIEAYWSKHTTPVVQEIAHRAIEITIQNLRKAVDYPDNLRARENLCRASVLAGLAFSQTKTTACHSISYPLTMFYGVPHGIAASITLDAVGQINKGHFPNDDTLFKLFEDYGGIMNYINLACNGVIDMRLSAFGITEKNISLIVKNAFTGGRMNNNPVDLTEDDVVLILESVK